VSLLVVGCGPTYRLTLWEVSIPWRFLVSVSM
jgi:hypothetical protein